MPIVLSAAPPAAEAPLLEALSAIRQLERELNSFGADESASDASLRLIVEHIVQWLPGVSAHIAPIDAFWHMLGPAVQISAGSRIGPPPGAELCFPLQAAGETVGVLYLQCSSDRTCSQAEMLLLEIACEHAALALRSARHSAGPSPDRAASLPADQRSLAPSGAAQAGDSPRVQALSDGVAALPPNVNRARDIVTAAQAEPRRGLAVLTLREREVLALLAEGMTNKQIASMLVITPNTVKRHLKAIFEKLSVRTRSAAAATAISARFLL